MTLYDDAVRTLARWQPPTTQQGELRTHFLAHLSAHADGLTRDCHPDHITASALVVSHDRSRVLLNLHRRYRMWMQFGGHCEPGDAALAEAALRETTEESGVTGLQIVGSEPVQLDRHEVRCGPLRPSHHLDVRYLAVAPPGAESQAAASEESLDVRWFAHDDLPPGLEPSVLDLLRVVRTSAHS